MKTFYFTATGNSLYVARRIGGELLSIPRMLSEGNRYFADAAIGFVFPCHGFGLPRILRHFLLSAHFQADYFFGVMTYGNFSAAGLKHLQALGNSIDITFNYLNEIIMVDNYVPLFKIEEQVAKEGAKQIETKLAQIVNDIHTLRTNKIKKGLSTTLFSHLVNRYCQTKFYDDADMAFCVNEKCNSCAICEQVCPKGNIQIDGRPAFRHNCDSCYACLHHCPQNAIHLTSERSSTRYRNSNTTLTDIIKSNQQHC